MTHKDLIEAGFIHFHPTVGNHPYATVAFQKHIIDEAQRTMFVLSIYGYPYQDKTGGYQAEIQVPHFGEVFNIEIFGAWETRTVQHLIDTFKNLWQKGGFDYYE